MLVPVSYRAYVGKPDRMLINREDRVMEFREFQDRALRTDQNPGGDLSDIVIHLLGLAGEAGSVASEYKKMLRDGGSHALWRPKMREELGDVLWYVAAIARHLDLDLNEIAQANLEKTADRWMESSSAALDAGWPDAERLPRTGIYEFVPSTAESGRPAVDLFLDGEKVGAQLTDTSTTATAFTTSSTSAMP